MDPTRQLRTYLEWLRDMGITALDAGSPAIVPDTGPAATGPSQVLTAGGAGPSSEVHPPAGSPVPAEKAGDRARQQDLFGASPRAEAPPAAPPDPEEAQKQLDRIRREIGDCRLCRLHEQRTNIVFGEGNPAARLVFAGEGPGRDEDATGRPFVGRAGQLLDRIIAAMGLERQQCYICNVVKCRPPDNRTPREDEMLICGQFLTKQLEVIRPQVIVALGSTAARYLLSTNASMSRLRGRVFDHPSGARLVPTYHPAYLLRNPSAKKPVWQDMQKVMELMNLKGKNR